VATKLINKIKILFSAETVDSLPCCKMVTPLG